MSADAGRKSRSAIEVTMMSSPQWLTGVRMLPALAATPLTKMLSLSDDTFSRGAYPRRDIRIASWTRAPCSSEARYHTCSSVFADMFKTMSACKSGDNSAMSAL